MTEKWSGCSFKQISNSLLNLFFWKQRKRDGWKLHKNGPTYLLIWPSRQFLNLLLHSGDSLTESVFWKEKTIDKRSKVFDRF